MPRIGRIYVEDGVFHILARGNNKQTIFHDDIDFYCFKKILKDLKKDYPFKLYHYCLMPNHIHLLLETNRGTQLSEMMKRLNLSYYHYYRKKYGYVGHLWQGRFKSLLVEKEKYLMACGLYIERNPLRANIVSQPDDYLHSSCAFYSGRRQDSLVDCDPFFLSVSDDPKARRREYARLIMNNDKVVSEHSFNGLFLGSVDFIESMNERFSIGKQKGTLHGPVPICGEA
jgi:putative transposase